MTNKDLTWKLKAQPTAGELADLVANHVLTPDEARDIIFNKGKRDDASRKTTVIHMLIDASGSMESCRNETIKGYNEYINSLKKDGGKFKFSLSFFDSDHMGQLRLKKVHEAVNIDDVPSLTRETFVPNGGTPLYDAFCSTLKSVDNKPYEKNLFVVMTDGGENASQEFTEKNMAKMKSDKEDEGNWTFVYLGANQDAWAVASKFGYSVNNVSSFNATAAGTGMVFDTLSVATRSMSAAPAMASSVFYTSEQKSKNENTK